MFNLHIWKIRDNDKRHPKLYYYIMGRRGKRTRPRTASNAKARRSPTAGGNQSAADIRETKVRKVPNWARFVIGAFVTAIVGLLVANIYPYVNSRIFPTPPIIFRVSENEVDGVYWGIIVPDQQRLQPHLNSIDSCDSLRAAAFAAGGVDQGSVSLNLIVQGNSKSGVTITGMHVRIIKRAAPLNGAYVFCSGAGDEDAMPVNFNLDDQVPQALGAPSGQASKPSYFANGSVVHLDDDEVYPFRIGASVSDSAVEWVIDVSVVINGRPGTVTIDDNGKPFETTASLPDSQYGDLYEYGMETQQRLMHFRSYARNPDDCAANVAMRSLQNQGLSAPAQVLTVDCSGDMAHVEIWVPSEHCFVHYLGFHRQSHWSFFASRAVCPGNVNLGALFSSGTIGHAGGNPQLFASAFGGYIVSKGSIPANPGPYDHVPRLSVSNLAARAGCTAMQSLASNYSSLIGVSQAATCRSQGSSLLILTFPDLASRDKFYSRAGHFKSIQGQAIGPRELLVIGPTWLVYATTTASIDPGIPDVANGPIYQQFVQQIGGESGQYALYGEDTLNGTVPTIANGQL